jgi:hypothetical protein
VTRDAAVDASRAADREVGTASKTAGVFQGAAAHVATRSDPGATADVTVAARRSR